MNHAVFLSNTQRPRDFATTDSILGVLKHPHCGKPLIQTDRGVFHDGSDLNGELPPGVVNAALPPKLVFQEAGDLRPTGRANNPVLPFGPTGNKIVQAVLSIREMQDGFLEGLGFVEGFHTSSLTQNLGLVKYIIALTLAVHCNQTKINETCKSLAPLILLRRRLL